PAFEWVHVQLHQQKGMISLSPPTICNSAHEYILAFEDLLVKLCLSARTTLRQLFVFNFI
ncbi:hypothetical protein OH654_09585, partial [Klebsiella pneumoniae]|uniref:hypothetical protein n=1 Tax=Klebsiella pneumoniae TaxID=573 RepID=UPI0021F3F2CC